MFDHSDDSNVLRVLTILMTVVSVLRVLTILVTKEFCDLVTTVSIEFQ